MASEFGPDVSLLAKVKSVSEEDDTCVLVDDDGIDFFDVRLRPVLDGNKSLTLVPTVGTWALAIRLEGTDDWMLIHAGEFDKVHLTAVETVFNDGEKGGLVNWPDAKTQLDRMNARLEAVIDALTNWTVVPNDGGAALKVQVGANLAGKPEAAFENLEDETVKH